jgi:hypothetical protein
MAIVNVKDGDTISVIVKLDPSATDPSLQIPAVANSYRVVANSFGPKLELVPLSDKITCLSEVIYKQQQQ